MSSYRGAYLLYLNGLAIPCPAASVNAGVGMIPEASFSLAPHPLLQRLGADDRIEVVIFFLDEHGVWRLLFEGEILGWSYANTPMGTKMNFTAIADIIIFSQLKYNFMTATDVVAHALSPTASTDTVAQPGAYYPFSLFKKGLVYGSSGGTEKLTPDITRPFEILFNAVRGMMDANLHSVATGTPASIPLVNFFARWARKRNFQNRFTALPVFEDGDAKSVFPILESIQNDYAMKALQSGLAGGGDQGSMWTVLQQVFTTMYFEIAMIPTAAAYRVRLSDGRIMGLDGEVDDVDGAERLKNPMRIANYFVKPQTIFGIPPTCNVLFPSMVKTLEYSENYMSQPTRYYVNESLITGMLKDDAMVSAALIFGYPEAVNAAMRAKVEGTGTGTTRVAGDVMSSGRNVLVYPEEFYKGPVSESGSVPSWFTILMSKHNSTKAASPNHSSADENSSVEAAPSDAPIIQSLFDTYVRYEYFRKRYEKRGGSATLHWNPYIVPGFPCFIFDRRGTGMDIAGYVQSVTWSLSTGNMSTSITYGYGRTLQEFLQTQYEDSVKYGLLGAGPAEMLPTVRDVVQRPDKAEEFYRGIFHGRGESRYADNSVAPAAAMLDTLVGVETETGVESVALNVHKGEATKLFTVNTPNIPKYNQIPDFNVTLQPLEEMESTFFDHEQGLAYASRPICTMAEYIRFKKGKNPDTEPTEMDLGTPYYARLYSLVQGPAGTAPDATMTGAVGTVDPESASKASATVYTGPKNPVPPAFPQTRINWDRILEAYLEEIRKKPPLL